MDGGCTLRRTQTLLYLQTSRVSSRKQRASSRFWGKSLSLSVIGFGSRLSMVPLLDLKKDKVAMLIFWLSGRLDWRTSSRYYGLRSKPWGVRSMRLFSPSKNSDAKRAVKTIS